ncbi:hypothetical protein EDF57_11428 [Novosphingobium sp. PhB55]|uniref:DUF6429 family protein n=1 Tax=Novosphingobium sp. PhB55 TaxID=2485106 RepID=UPI00106526F8|nr:DUF6429 family protein [Novosphingobium sp. PhB55]TDW59246.1 hypothetical protein EDF57_11428 [Novosphingobium sp. PhB55]
MKEQDIDSDRIDEAVLALMFLTLHDLDRTSGTCRAWKPFDWDALGRLYKRGLIQNPVGKKKSVGLTSAGRERCEQQFRRLFCASRKP